MKRRKTDEAKRLFKIAYRCQRTWRISKIKDAAILAAAEYARPGINSPRNSDPFQLKVNMLEMATDVKSRLYYLLVYFSVFKKYIKRDLAFYEWTNRYAPEDMR